MEYLTNEQILEKYENLPEDLKEAIFSAGMAGTVKIIGDKYKLYVDKIGELENETGMVMLGLTHPKDFVSNLAQRLGVDKETAKKIAEEVNAQIFVKVRESLKKIHKLEEEKQVEEIKKEDIKKEIEKKEEIFEAKTKEEIFIMPKEEKKYPQGDPYKEPVG